MSIRAATPRRRSSWWARLHPRHHPRTVAALALAASLGLGSVQASNAPPASTFPSSASGIVDSADASPHVCANRDPHAGIYHPARLVVVNPCQTVTGTVAAIKKEADGDYHIRVTLDAAYAQLINDANRQLQHGDLIVEIPCVNTVTQADAKSPCAAIDPQLKLTPPAVGQHVSITGPYVNDHQHGWMEIHPVYIWAPMP
jgi:hypothetical protein